MTTTLPQGVEEAVQQQQADTAEAAQEEAAPGT